MTLLPKAAKDVLEKLSGKYGVVDNRTDNFTDNGYARLEKGDSLVEIAPAPGFQHGGAQLMAGLPAQTL